MLWLALFEGIAAADQRARAEGGIHLVGRKRDVIQMRGVSEVAHVDLAMRGKLRTIDKDLGTGGVGPTGQRVNVGHVAGHIRRPGHRDQPNPPGVPPQKTVEMCIVQRTTVVHADMFHLCLRPPRQIVAVMLHLRYEDDIIRAEVQAPGHLVGGFGRVLAEDHHMLVAVCADKIRDDAARFFIGCS